MATIEEEEVGKEDSKATAPRRKGSSRNDTRRASKASVQGDTELIDTSWKGQFRFIRRHGSRGVVGQSRRQKKINAKSRRLTLKLGKKVPAWLRRKGDPV